MKDMRHGKGKEVTNDGEINEGQWIENAFQDEIVEEEKSDQVVEEVFQQKVAGSVTTFNRLAEQAPMI